ncbi:hypothetical protein AB0D91_46295 [Streptomyces canus]|uniref:hypothetical protein n=1 Tax=Streptomyces canus TaxID=58343 RepID=UPI0033DD6466
MRAGSPLCSQPEAATGKVIGSLYRRHRAEEFKNFLLELGKEVPADIQLICDYYATQDSRRRESGC